mmetsp:Transcript_28851/g.46778  ORF Transcript_28851/g.46778 Transcript_28851/m.46778 type:complete len:289 (-) Transcript_28851:83-949(-)
MPNIHGLSSIRNNNNRPSNDSDSDNDENNRYVGGVSSRGGGSGLAVLPNHENADASESIFNLAEAGSAPSNNSNSNNNNGGGEVRRMITMYRSGFTVDNGPYRQLNDPSNAEFLGSLARGLIPRELREDGEDGEGGEVMVGLVDKRGEEYDEERHGQPQQQASSSSSGGFQSFSGQGQSLIDSSTSATSSGGIIDPNTITTPPPPLDTTLPSTSIAIRLLNGKRIVVKINLQSPVLELGQHIGSSADGGAGGESYVMTSGYPPAVIEDLSVSVEEAGLKGAQVVLKKA